MQVFNVLKVSSMLGRKNVTQLDDFSHINFSFKSKKTFFNGEKGTLGKFLACLSLESVFFFFEGFRAIKKQNNNNNKNKQNKQTS